MYVHGLIIDEATETLFKPIVYLKHINYFLWWKPNNTVLYCSLYGWPSTYYIKYLLQQLLWKTPNFLHASMPMTWSFTQPAPHP